MIIKSPTYHVTITDENLDQRILFCAIKIEPHRIRSDGFTMTLRQIRDTMGIDTAKYTVNSLIGIFVETSPDFADADHVEVFTGQSEADKRSNEYCDIGNEEKGETDIGKLAWLHGHLIDIFMSELPE